MKASELITDLVKLIAAHGDRQVTSHDDSRDTNITGIDYRVEGPDRTFELRSVLR